MTALSDSPTMAVLRRPSSIMAAPRPSFAKAVFSLCLLCAIAVPTKAAPVGDPTPAQQEELTLLFHGALQLGQALNGVYKATETRLQEASSSLGLYGQTLGFLGQELNHGRDAALKLRTNLLEMQVEEDILKLQAEATAEMLVEVAQGQLVLRETMQRLETQLRGVWLGPAHQEFEALKARVNEQSHIIWVLTGHVQRQKQEMEAQQRRLRQIQERLHTAALPA